MIAGLPPKIASIEGEITLKELLRSQAPHCVCAVHRDNLRTAQLPLPSCVRHAMGNLQPRSLPRAAAAVVEHPTVTQPKHIAAELDHARCVAVSAEKLEEGQNMNKALTKRFLSLVPTEHQQGYAEIMTREPNCRFNDAFNHFYMEFGLLDEVEVESNKEEMKKP